MNNPGWGNPEGVSIDTDWQGAPPPLQAQVRVRSRAACDIDPPNIADRAQRLRLRSYIWADQPQRLRRFDAAAELAVATGVSVERADAGHWLQRRLQARPQGGGAIVYHSIFMQYLTRDARSRIRTAIEEAGARATGDAPLAWLRFEPEVLLGGPRDSVRIALDMVTWPGAERRLLAMSDGHANAVEVAA